MRKPVWVIEVHGTTYRFKTLNAALVKASAIFAATGVVVGVTKAGR